MTAFWNDAKNCAKIEECMENKNGWWNTIMLESNWKGLAIITVYRIVDTNTTSINQCKAQHERKCGKIKRAKEIRKELLNDLEKETNEIKATDVIIVGDFNEDVNAKDVQEFMVEMGLQEVFREIHEVNEDDRDGTFEYGKNVQITFQFSEGLLNVVEGTELIECNEVVDSDYLRCLTDVNFETHFGEDFNKEI